MNDTYFYLHHTDQYFHSLNLYFFGTLAEEIAPVPLMDSDEVKQAEWVPFADIRSENIHSHCWPALQAFKKSLNQH